MEFDLIIVGGGLAGASLAVALRDTPLKIALVEARPPQRSSGWDSRIYAISPGNAELLRQWGIWRHLDRDRLQTVESMVVKGDRGGLLEFSAYAAGVPELAWIVESSLMAVELWETAKRQTNLELLCPARPGRLHQDETGVRLTLEDGRTLGARLLVGADGRDSWVRTQAGLLALDSPYHEMGVVANFACSRPHQGYAFQWFRPDGVLAYLPLAGDQISIVWSTPDDHARELLALSPEALSDRVAAAGERTLGELELITAAEAFPLRLIRVPRIHAQRVALVGDAAHGIHPLSGHGINLGFQDVATLADLLRATPDWQDIGSDRLLARYQRARREEIVTLQTVTDGLRRLFRQDLPGLSALRNIGLTLTDRLAPVKSAFIRYALES